jgi:hypothetical protein
MLRQLLLMGLLIAGGPSLLAASVQGLDGDQAEALTARVDGRLSHWLEVLSEGEGAPIGAATNFRGAVPKPEAWSSWLQGTLHGSTSQAWDGHSAPFEHWFKALGDPLVELRPFAHSKSKVIGVSPEVDGTFNTQVLWELSSMDSSQVWIRLDVEWGKGDDPWAIQGSVVSYATSKTSKPMFIERTHGVFASEKSVENAVCMGGREWASRLDDGAASAWFGHQGMAVGDVNGDGLEDLFVGMPSGLPNHLLVQQPDGSVRDLAHTAGVDWYDDTKGVLLVDLDGDGDRDLVAALNHFLVLHANDGTGKFKVAGWCAAPDEAAFYSIAAADVDGDGDLDLFGTRYVTTRYGESIPIPLEDARNGPSNHLFLNQGEFRFVDGTSTMGLAGDNQRFSLAASFSDFDGDGDSDLYVANDFGRNQLYRNDGERFVDVAAELGVEDQAAGMGVSWADADGDGDMDLHVSNMFSSAGRRVSYQEFFRIGADDHALEGIRRHAQGNSLWLQGDDGRFVDASDRAGVRMGRWSWGTLFTDLDGDGTADLYGPNGFMTGREAHETPDL